MDFGKLVSDPTKEGGVWVPIDNETSLKVAFTGSDEYVRKVQRRMRPYAKLVGAGGGTAIPEAEGEAVAISSLVDDVLLDWKGLKENGVDVPYSKENSRRLLGNRRFRQLVESIASDIDNFRESKPEDDAKNSEAASAGA